MMSEPIGRDAPPSAREGTAPTLHLLPAAARTLGAAVLGAGIWIGFAGPLQLTWGLVAVAVFVGWLVGSAARSGAKRPDGRVRAVAVGGALLAWPLSLVGVYLYSLAALPGLGPAGSSLTERIAATPIVAFYAPQVGPIDVIEVLALLAAAWWSAR